MAAVGESPPRRSPFASQGDPSPGEPSPQDLSSPRNPPASEENHALDLLAAETPAASAPDPETTSPPSHAELDPLAETPAPVPASAPDPDSTSPPSHAGLNQLAETPAPVPAFVPDPETKFSDETLTILMPGNPPQKVGGLCTKDTQLMLWQKKGRAKTWTLYKLGTNGWEVYLTKATSFKHVELRELPSSSHEAGALCALFHLRMILAENVQQQEWMPRVMHPLTSLLLGTRVLRSTESVGGPILPKRLSSAAKLCYHVSGTRDPGTPYISFMKGDDPNLAAVYVNQDRDRSRTDFNVIVVRLDLCIGRLFDPTENDSCNSMPMAKANAKRWNEVLLCGYVPQVAIEKTYVLQKKEATQKKKQIAKKLHYGL